MILRADHVAGAAFVAFGLAVIALSGDLPAGQLSMPGSGFLPKLIAALLIVFGIALFLRARESAPYSELGWHDGKHAAQVIAITAVAIGFYTVLGFLITLSAMVFGVLVIIERRHPLRALVYAVCVVSVTYTVFAYALKIPLPDGPLGY